MVRQTQNKNYEYYQYGDNDHLRAVAQKSRATALDTTLARFQREEHTLGDTENAAIPSDGEAVHAMAVVIDETNNDVGVFFLTGDGNSVTELGETGSAFGVGSKGTDNQTNLYWDTDQYEIENQTGGEVTYEVIFLRAV